MVQINENFKKLQGSYLFAEMSKREREYREKNPDKKVLKLGIGDVTRPLTSEVIKGLRVGVEDMAKSETFMGYGPYEGYSFLRKAIVENDFAPRGVSIKESEVFVSTGAKEDTAAIQEIFSTSSKIAITDPVYPVYVDSNVMAGRSGDFVDGRYQNFVYLDCTEENHFIPALPKEAVDIIFLCFPNNPTGQVITKEELKKWVDYARKNQAVIMYDAAYVAYIQDDSIPQSIYEIEGAKEVAIEFRSYSKTAGFTGTRCAYTIIPEELLITDTVGEKHSLNKLWFRRQSTKFNGTSYIIQKGAEGVYTEAGKKETKQLIEYYLNNAKIIREGIESIGLKCTGGVNSPYIWLKTPNNMKSWEFFDLLLKQCQVVGTPGSGFGKCGEGYFRLSSFGRTEDTKEAIARIKGLKF